VEGTLCCDVCGLLISNAVAGYRCLVCQPEYDLCAQCYARGETTLGHRSEHATRQMDPKRHSSDGGGSSSSAGGGASSGGDRLTAFPADCLESQCFYTDGELLMVVIPPHLFGSKVPGHLCRVFCARNGDHLYDISMGDPQDDIRRDLGKPGASGALCFDPLNDLVWHVDSAGKLARRWGLIPLGCWRNLTFL
jgi:hypothetical protein